METTREISIKLNFDRRQVLLALAFFFVAWHPGEIGSETLTLTTYYPAPYGGYVRILTTGDTILARDGGVASYVRVGNGWAGGRRNATVKLEVGDGDISTQNRVFWGAGRAQLNNDQGGSIELGGTGGTPYVDFSRTMTEDYSARLYLSQAGRLRVRGSFEVSSDLRANRDIVITTTGTIRGLCSRTPYTLGALVSCPLDVDGIRRKQVVGYVPDGVTRLTGFLPQLGADISSGLGTPIALGQDWGGNMICCRVEFN